MIRYTIVFIYGEVWNCPEKDNSHSVIYDALSEKYSI